jgi:hypothetical protein
MTRASQVLTINIEDEIDRAGGPIRLIHLYRKTRQSVTQHPAKRRLQ